MNLTRDNWLTIILAVGGIVLTVALNIGVREWYQPDVRYGTGGAYLSGNLAISSMELMNFGRSKEENITISATFADPLTEIGTGKTSMPFVVSAGGIGQKFVTGGIKTLVPEERVPIYFITVPSSPQHNYGSFVQNVKSDNGLVKTGIPTLYALPALLLVIVGVGAMWIAAYYLLQWLERNDDARLSEAIQIGHAAAQEGLSEEQMNARVVERRQMIPFYRRGKKHSQTSCAQAAYTVAKTTETRPTGEG